METFPSQTSAFRSAQPQPDPETKEHPHSQMWNNIQPGLNTGRTYHYASCCATIFDKRKKDNIRADLNHSDSTSMAKVLGKRAFLSLEDFSVAILEAEKKLKKPIDTITFNRSHLETQNAVKLDALERRINELEQSSNAKTDSLEKRIQELEKSNLELKDLLETETSRNRGLIAVSRALIFKEKLCPQCRRQPEQQE